MSSASCSGDQMSRDSHSQQFTALWNWVTEADGETIEAAFPDWGRHIFLRGLLVGSLLALGGSQGAL
jgi:hypothetical protein